MPIICRFDYFRWGQSPSQHARELLKKLKITTIDIIGLAKEDAKHEKGLTQEKIYLLEREDPLILDLQSPLLFLLQRIRDDAHNAAIIFHKKRRGKGSLAREKITGISDVKMNLLLKHFKSLSNIKAATLASLRKIPGITVRDLNALQKHFKQK